MEFGPARFDVVSRSHALMTMQERVVLYGLIVGLQPSRILEIGSFKGGSAMIICAALDDLGAGSMVCVDPNPQVSPETRKAIGHRATILAVPSPQGLPAALELAGGRFDFALIDGDHAVAGALADLEAVLGVLSDDATIVLHDAHYWEVGEAVDRFLSKHRRVVDAGLMSRGVTSGGQVVDGHDIAWGGLRVLKLAANRTQKRPRIGLLSNLR